CYTSIRIARQQIRLFCQPPPGGQGKGDAMGKKKKEQNAKKKSAGNHSYINRKYKNSLFRMLFSDREALLSLYNAVNQTAYKDPRSEEHTSELQSRFDLVCRLLLEKKKQDITTKNNIQ